MTPTKAMIQAARRAEFDYYQKGRQIGPGRFIPTPNDVIKVMLEAALKLVETADAPVATRRKMTDVGEPVTTGRKSAIVEARKPRPRRR
jgi:hypothetical protein